MGAAESPSRKLLAGDFGPAQTLLRAPRCLPDAAELGQTTTRLVGDVGRGGLLLRKSAAREVRQREAVLSECHASLLEPPGPIWRKLGPLGSGHGDGGANGVEGVPVPTSGLRSGPPARHGRARIGRGLSRLGSGRGDRGREQRVREIKFQDLLSFRVGSIASGGRRKPPEGNRGLGRAPAPPPAAARRSRHGLRTRASRWPPRWSPRPPRSSPLRHTLAHARRADIVRMRDARNADRQIDGSMDRWIDGSMFLTSPAAAASALRAVGAS